MEATLYTNILKAIGFVVSIIGILIGVDLIFGGPIISISKRALEKSYDFDRWVKRTVEKSFDFDKVITNPRAKKTLGIAFLIFSLIILLLVNRV